MLKELGKKEILSNLANLSEKLGKSDAPKIMKVDGKVWANYDVVWPLLRTLTAYHKAAFLKSGDAETKEISGAQFIDLYSLWKLTKKVEVHLIKGEEFVISDEELKASWDAEKGLIETLVSML